MNKKTLTLLFINSGYTLIAFFFIYHGVLAFTFPESFIAAAMLSGVGISTAKVLLVLVGILDVIVGLSLIFNRINWIVWWAALWPIVPAITGSVLYPDQLTHQVGEHVAITVGIVVALIVFKKMNYEKFVWHKFWEK